MLYLENTVDILEYIPCLINGGHILYKHLIINTTVSIGMYIHGGLHYVYSTTYTCAMYKQ